MRQNKLYLMQGRVKINIPDPLQTSWTTSYFPIVEGKKMAQLRNKYFPSMTEV